MDDATNREAENPPVGLPEPDPPRGGPNADRESPEPADLVPGLGGTSQTRPASTDNDEPEPSRSG